MLTLLIFISTRLRSMWSGQGTRQRLGTRKKHGPAIATTRLSVLLPLFHSAPNPPSYLCKAHIHGRRSLTDTTIPFPASTGGERDAGDRTTIRGSQVRRSYAGGGALGMMRTPNTRSSTTNSSSCSRGHSASIHLRLVLLFLVVAIVATLTSSSPSFATSRSASSSRSAKGHRPRGTPFLSCPPSPIPPSFFEIGDTHLPLL